MGGGQGTSREGISTGMRGSQSNHMGHPTEARGTGIQRYQRWRKTKKLPGRVRGSIVPLSGRERALAEAENVGKKKPNRDHDA